MRMAISHSAAPCAISLLFSLKLVKFIPKENHDNGIFIWMYEVGCIIILHESKA